MARALPNKIITAFPPHKKVAGLSPRAYQARLDLCRLWDLVCMNKPQAEIAETMGKDPAWVSRSVKRIQADFSLLYGTPDEERLVRENLARLQSIYAEALKIASTSEGYSRVAALRLAAEIVHQQAKYEITVGYVANRRDPSEANAPTMEELRGEITDTDLDAILGTIMEEKGWRRPALAAAEG